MELVLSTPHLLRRILSFCNDGKSCYYFGITCKNVFEEYSTMMRISSHMKYRLAFANRDEGYMAPLESTWEKYRCFDLFDPPVSLPTKFKIDSNFYVTSIEEYENSIVPKSSSEEEGEEEEEIESKPKTYDRWNIQKFIDTEFTPVILGILSDLNKEKPFSCMISGSFAMLHFLRTKDFKSHSRKVNREFDLELNQKIPHLYIPPRVRDERNILEVPKYFEDQDIDVFLLGENKTETCERILLELNERLDDLKSKIQVVSRRGCTDVYLRIEGITEGRYYGQTKYRKFLQIISKRHARQPIDIFSFFDLDCCKIGYFPGNRKVVTTPRFIQSITKYMNYADLQYQKVSNRHKTRISKYFFRLGIRTSIELPHPMSFFHSFVPIVDPKTYHACDYYKWGDFFLDGNGVTYQLPGRFPSGHHKTWSGKKWDPKFNLNRDPLNPPIEPLLDENARFFHFCQIGTEVRIPEDTAKTKISEQYTTSDEDDECNKKENMFRLDVVKMMIDVRRYESNLNQSNNRRVSKESEKKMRVIHKKWRSSFQIGEVNFSYYYSCYGITQKRKKGRVYYGYFEKIFPRRVKALLRFDKEKKLFEPFFLERYKCAKCEKVNMELDKPFQTCGRCRNVFYCSRKCQVRHWKVHKLKCEQE